MITQLRDKIAGAVYGMALGDAMGMPAELWSRDRARAFFGTIEDFLDGPQENEVARNYRRGQFTDDTAQGLVLVRSLAATDFVPDPRDIAMRLIAWAESVNAWENGILGPTSKIALANFRDGIDASPVTNSALSNGSAMRIAPIGCLFSPDKKDRLADYVFDVTRATHSSNVAVAGACMIAEAVASAIVNADFTRVLADTLAIEPLGYDRGYDFHTPRLAARTRIALDIARDCKGDDDGFLRQIYDVTGTGVPIIESVPAAIAVADYARDPNRAALLCANLGGDTDTIGAMATAICGAYTGLSAFRPDFIATLRSQNDADLDGAVDTLIEGREKLA